jgi:hypothetical protein
MWCWGQSLQRVVHSLVAAAAFFLLSSEVRAADLLPPVPFIAEQADRFDGWYAGGFWANPLDTFTADHGTNPLSSAMLTGSLFGVAGGRGFQPSGTPLYFGFSGSVAGGVVEGQSSGSACPGNCYTSLNGLGEITLSAGFVFWQRFLVYVGGGPNFAIMRSGQTFYGLNQQFVSGEHGTLGVKFAVDDHWSFSAQVERVRVGDLYYNTPTQFIGVNTNDFWLATLGFDYRFFTPSQQP